MATKKTIQKTAKIDLADLNLSDLVSAPAPAAKTNNQQNIVELDLRDIQEDPQQPRTKDNPGFKPESIKELAQTINLRGLKQPISVRIIPTMPGRYQINHGARRFRAFKLLDKKTIPAIIDNKYGLVDQAIENMQRSDLTSREIALLIDQLEKSGMKRVKIAEELGKTPGYVAQFARLNDLPSELEALFNDGHITDVTLIYEIAKFYDRNADQVPALLQWLATETDSISRSTWKLFKEVQQSKMGAEDPLDEQPSEQPEMPGMTTAAASVSPETDAADDKQADLSPTPSDQPFEHSTSALADDDGSLIESHQPPEPAAPVVSGFEAESDSAPMAQTASETSVSDESVDQKPPRPALNAVASNAPALRGQMQTLRVTYKGKLFAVVNDRVPDLGVSPYDERALFLVDEATQEIIRVDASLDSLELHSVVFLPEVI